MVVAAIILRLVWLVSELVAAGVLYVLGHQRLRPIPAEAIPDVELPMSRPGLAALAFLLAAAGAFLLRRL